MTIWYDFTTTRRNRSRNGIANVEWSIGAALIEKCGWEVRCFALDERNGLCEIEPSIDLARTPYAEAQQAPTVLPRSLARGLRGTVRAWLAAAFGPNSAAVERSLISVLGAFRELRARSRRAVSQRLPPARSAPRIVSMVGRHDVVISMGADWTGGVGRHLAELRRSTGCRVITMIYDLIPLTHTHLAFHADRALFIQYYRTLASASDLITCISAQTRRDLAQFFEEHAVAAPPTEVLTLGDGHRPPMLDRAPRAQFFLMVGTLERRKNVELIYDALRILESRGEPVPTVVVAGESGWGIGDFLHEIRVGTSAAGKAIVLLGTVDDRALDVLYQRARALLFPSHYEGWGLPLREAAVRGCPIAVGDCPAAREAVGAYAGAVMLPSDDAGPWADYIARPGLPVEPADFRDWSASVDDLLSLIESQVGSPRRSRR
jgi:glycosyltransferase involved in cell wall biosynthesis